MPRYGFAVHSSLTFQAVNDTTVSSIVVMNLRSGVQYINLLQLAISVHHYVGPHCASPAFHGVEHVII